MAEEHPPPGYGYFAFFLLTCRSGDSLAPHHSAVLRTYSGLRLDLPHGFSGSVYWILRGAGDGHHSRAHGAFMRLNGPQQTRPQGRAVRLIGHLNFVVGHKHHQIQPQGDSSFCASLRRLCTCLSACLRSGTAQTQAAVQSHSCVSGLSSYLSGLWPQVPGCSHFTAFTPRNHVSPRIGVGRVSIYSAQDLPCCDCSTEGDDVEHCPLLAQALLPFP